MNFCFLTLWVVSSFYCTSNAQENLNVYSGELERPPRREWEIGDEFGEGPDDPTKLRNVVAYDIPEKENENITGTALEIGLKLGIIKPWQHIDRAYRLKCPLPARPVVVKLLNTMLKEKWINCYLRRSLFNLGFRLKADEVHHKIRKLEEKTIKWAKEKNYAVWTLLSEVLYRKTNDSPVYKVKDLAHLKQVVENEFRFEVTDRIHSQFYFNYSQSYVPKFFNYTGPTPRIGPRPRRRG
uniref:Uncharacterized protein n=2 Tax=Cacopsylla melanoneura TaxID=428564 RepID=A0A8D8VQ58_9HEMI